MCLKDDADLPRNTGSPDVAPGDLIVVNKDSNILGGFNNSYPGDIARLAARYLLDVERSVMGLESGWPVPLAGLSLCICEFEKVVAPTQCPRSPARLILRVRARLYTHGV
ncbi:hypothetical protein CENSYa_0246 [Cenarchaeum symbiosum A]|uniref:Uncharacterized protein n=1 Tax=Cenarchaeum symbiosum (strain A) TaxID=414004 RepID=A0RU71_CENSY|nr:hypothetical protein CENSYa_0246 [Cenarchaeum symbiosum A]